jgi:hypothetical protein
MGNPSKTTDKELVRYHIIPEHNGEPKHEFKTTCWRSPVLDEQQEDDTRRIEIWNHNRTQ